MSDTIVQAVLSSTWLIILLEEAVRQLVDRAVEEPSMLYQRGTDHDFRHWSGNKVPGTVCRSHWRWCLILSHHRIPTVTLIPCIARASSLTRETPSLRRYLISSPDLLFLWAWNPLQLQILWHDPSGKFPFFKRVTNCHKPRQCILPYSADLLQLISVPQVITLPW